MRARAWNAKPRMNYNHESLLLSGNAKPLRHMYCTIIIPYQFTFSVAKLSPTAQYPRS